MRPRIVRDNLILLCALAWPGALSGQVALQWQAGIGTATHHILDAGTDTRANGLILGAGIGASIGPKFDVWADVAGGHLRSSDSSFGNHDVANVQFLGSYTIQPWLRLRAGPGFRGYSNDLARQHWTTLRVGAEARVGLGLESLQGMLEAYWIPVADVSGLASPQTALAAGAATQWRGERITVTLRYRLERYDFPGGGGASAIRLEEFSSLQLLAGMRFHKI